MLRHVTESHEYLATELQNQPRGGVPVLGEFDSHTLPPDKLRLPGFGSLLFLRRIHFIQHFIQHFNFDSL